MQLVSLVSFLTYLQTRRIGSILQYLSFQATKILVCSLVLSRLDYGNVLLAASPQVLLDQTQRVINCSAHFSCKAPKSFHITPLYYDLYWLPVSSGIHYKIAMICFHTASGRAPPYLSELLHLCSPSRSLRSALDTRIFRVPRIYTRTLGEISFFNTSNLWSGTLFLSLSGIGRLWVCLPLSEN